MMSGMRTQLKRLAKSVIRRGQATEPGAAQARHDIRLKTAVIVRISGGLANQMICYKVGRYVSAVTRRSLIIDATPFQWAGETNRNFQLMNHPLRYDAMISSDATMSDIKAGNHITFITREMLPLPNPSAADAAAVMDFIASKDIVYCDFWLGMALRAPMDAYAEKNGILDELTLDCEKCFGEKDFECLGEIRNAASPVAVHVRRGDFATHDGSLLLATDYYNDSIRSLEQRLEQPVFFVFSDDIEWCRRNLKSSSEMKFVDFTDERQAYKDMYLASQCRHFILTNESTFSHQVVQLARGGNASRIVITSGQKDLIRNSAPASVAPD